MDIYKEPSYKALFLFSIPSILSSVLEPLAGVVDTAFVGQLNTVWLAALAIGVTLFNSFTWIFNFLAHVSTHDISEAYASDDKDLLAKSIKLNLTTALVVGLLSALVLFLFRFPLYKLAGATPEYIDLVDEYFCIRLLAHPFGLLAMNLISIHRGMGRVRLSFVLVVIATLLNIFLSWLFLYKFEVGISGVAFGTCLSFFITTASALIILFKDSGLRRLFMASKLDKESFSKFSAKSINMLGRTTALVLSFFLATRMATYLGVVELAAYQIMLQAWLFASFFVDGIAITGNILCSYHIQKNNREELKIVCNRLLKMGAFIGLVFTLLYMLGESFIVPLFTKDPVVIGLISGVWIIIYSTQIIGAIAFVYDGLLFGLNQFEFLRKKLWFGFFCVFSPMCFIFIFYPSLMVIWLALIALVLYRIIVYYKKVQEILNGV